MLLVGLAITLCIVGGCRHEFDLSSDFALADGSTADQLSDSLLGDLDAATKDILVPDDSTIDQAPPTPDALVDSEPPLTDSKVDVTWDVGEPAADSFLDQGQDQNIDSTVIPVDTSVDSPSSDTTIDAPPGPFNPGTGPWQRHAGNPLVAADQSGVDHKGAFSPVVYAAGNKYLMWYAGKGSTSADSVSYYQATSVDGITWQKDLTPVLSPGGAAWDSTLYGFTVLHDGSVFHMYYIGASGIRRIGHATASDADGKVWVKSANNPVISPGGTYDQTFKAIGSVYDSTNLTSPYLMWYGATGTSPFASIAHATSSDGDAWNKEGVAISGLNAPGNTGISVINDNGTYRLWHSELHAGQISIYYQEFGGSSWSFGSASNPVLLKAGTSWESGGMGDFSVVRITPDALRLYYDAKDSGGEYQIGLATIP